MWIIPKKKTEFEVKMLQIIDENPNGLRAYLISEGYQSEKLMYDSQLLAAAKHLVSCNKDRMLNLLTLHPDYELFSDVYKWLENKESSQMVQQTQMIVNVQPTEVEINADVNIQKNDLQSQAKYVYLGEQPQELPTPMPTPMPTPNLETDKVMEYLEVKDVCIYGLPIKHWLIGISVLLVVSVIITAIKNR